MTCNSSSPGVNVLTTNSAASEYGAKFRTDLEAFLSPEALQAVTVAGRYELPRVEGRRYVAFTDPSGGMLRSCGVGRCPRRDSNSHGVAPGGF